MPGFVVDHPAPTTAGVTALPAFRNDKRMFYSFGVIARVRVAGNPSVLGQDVRPSGVNDGRGRHRALEPGFNRLPVRPSSVQIARPSVSGAMPNDPSRAKASVLTGSAPAGLVCEVHRLAAVVRSSRAARRSRPASPEGSAKWTWNKSASTVHRVSQVSPPSPVCSTIPASAALNRTAQPSFESGDRHATEKPLAVWPTRSVPLCGIETLPVVRPSTSAEQGRAVRRGAAHQAPAIRPQSHCPNIHERVARKGHGGPARCSVGRAIEPVGAQPPDIRRR